MNHVEDLGFTDSFRMALICQSEDVLIDNDEIKDFQISSDPISEPLFRAAAPLIV
jgi:hypothetical protein